MKPTSIQQSIEQYSSISSLADPTKLAIFINSTTRYDFKLVSVACDSNGSYADTIVVTPGPLRPGESAQLDISPQRWYVTSYSFLYLWKVGAGDWKGHYTATRTAPPGEYYKNIGARMKDPALMSEDVPSLEIEETLETIPGQ